MASFCFNILFQVFYHGNGLATTHFGRMNNKRSAFSSDSQNQLSGELQNSQLETEYKDTNLFPDSRKVEHVFSAYKAPIENVKPHTTMSMANVFEYISGNTFERVTDEVRAITDVIEQGKYKAQNFNYVTFSGIFTTRANSKLKSHSGLFCIDVDKLDNVAPLKLQIIETLPPSLLFVSPRGKGLKLVYKIAINQATHLDYFFAFEQYFKKTFGVEIDDKCKDVSRACFLSHDPDAYFNNDDDTLIDIAFIDAFPPDITTTPPKSNKPVTASQNSKNIAVTDYDVIMTYLKTWLDKKETFQEGNRNNYVTRLASAFNRYAVPEHVALPTLSELTQNGFTEEEIRKTVESVYRHTDRFGISEFDKNTPHSFAIEPPEATPETTPLLPIDGMPEYLQSFINEYTSVYNYPRDYIAGSVILSTALAIGNKMELKTKYDNIPVIWMALIGDVSAGKTHSMQTGMNIFKRMDDEASAIQAERVRAHDANKNKSKKDQDQDLQKRPIQHQYVVRDYTPETIRDIHTANQRGIIIYRDELKGWIDDFNRYNKSGEQSTMLSTFFQETMTINRGGKDPVTISKPTINVGGGLQPDLLKDLASDNRAESGFLSRIISVYPDHAQKPPHSDKKLAANTQSRYDAYLKTLIDISDTIQLKMSPEASEVYADWYNKNAIISNNEDSGYLKGVYGKLDVYAYRFAIILHGMSIACDANKNPILIDGKTMMYATQLTEYFRITALKVYRKLFSSDKPDISKKALVKQLHALGKANNEIAQFLEMDKGNVSRIINSRL